MTADPKTAAGEMDRWADALANVVYDLREGKNADAGKCLGIVAVRILDQRDEIERLRDVIRTVVVNLERGSPPDAVADWAKERINDDQT